jgi:hypothetical protein
MENLVKKSELVNVKLSYFANGIDNILVEKSTEKNQLVKGFAKFKKSCNLLTFGKPNTVFTVSINGIEIDFNGGKFAPKTSFFIDLISEKISSFEHDNKDLRKKIASFMLKDSDIVETCTILNKLETFTKLELVDFACDIKSAYLESITPKVEQLSEAK